MSTAEMLKTKLDKSLRALLSLCQETKAFEDCTIIHTLGIVDQCHIVPIISAKIRVQAIRNMLNAAT